MKAFAWLIEDVDEGGYYAEISDEQGRDVHTTELCDTEEMAERDACRWADGQRVELTWMD